MNYIQIMAGRVRDAIAPAARPSEDGESLYELYALLVLVKGEATDLADVHNAWSVWMQGIDPAHESLVPFERLSPQVRAEDRVYRDAIVKVAREAS